jgi:acetyl esterase/lipase
MPWLLLWLSVAGLLFTLNALYPRYAPGGVALSSFFAAWLTAELALHHIAWQGLVVAYLAHQGALAAWPGRLGLALTVLSWVLLLAIWRRAEASGQLVTTTLDRVLGDDDGELFGPLLHDASAVWRQLLFPIPVTHPAVECLRNIVYFESGNLRLKLNVFRRRDAEHGASVRRPALIFVHGGGWIVGSRNHHGLPMLQHLAARGWVCFNVGYRLSPRATLPDHIVDVKRAIAWVREHADEYGIDPDFIVISGGSAGGHLASLAALTPNRGELQPGFEGADTSVAACISLYGVYDLTNRHDHWPHPGLLDVLERWVIKAPLADARDTYTMMSPVSHLDDKAPPFLLIHGDCDSVVPVAEGRAFFAELREVSQAPCAYLEIPGAQHAFEIFPSPRTMHVLRGVERFVRHIYRQYARKRNSTETASSN